MEKDIIQVEKDIGGLWLNLKLKVGSAVKSHLLSQGFIHLDFENRRNLNKLSGLPSPTT